MSEQDYGRIIGANLKRLAWERRKTQADISRDLGISKATVSSWMNGTRIPRMDKIDMLCDYFSVKRSEIMEPHDEAVPSSGQESEYYLDEEAREMLRFLNENPKHKKIYMYHFKNFQKPLFMRSPY
jgi:transcriptional regulator with XRE-family HTH domain